jgi:hypothetical protein
MYDFTVDDESYTHITIQDLKDRIDTQLANPAKRQEWAREVGWLRLPPGSPAQMQHSTQAVNPSRWLSMCHAVVCPATGFS